MACHVIFYEGGPGGFIFAARPHKACSLTYRVNLKSTFIAVQLQAGWDVNVTDFDVSPTHTVTRGFGFKGFEDHIQSSLTVTLDEH